ncbi:endogenous retrovirus group K member 25 Env polyprotein-like [Heterocephalus glaber]|uniref:Endogenous retrovirus group K member 25 Env polyprotein-like n=1 Tax=Heterocephalus glaber TaxID=10181 RepID=A0AAX6QM86_HETGA|nr:endogenous retrovirus group K member 25 Env polyprotein-like [Heterocephalus glaber]
MKTMRDGYQNGSCTRQMSLQQILLLLMAMVTMTKCEMFWAYVPDPPLLHHPVTWEDSPVSVYVNNTAIAGPPSLGHIKEEIKEGFNYSGKGWGIPICFSQNGTVKSCLNFTWDTFNEGSLYGNKRHNIRMPWPSCGGSLEIDDPPQDYPQCMNKALTNNRIIPWARCRVDRPAIYNFTDQQEVLQDWSAQLDNCQGGANTEQQLTVGLWRVPSGPFQPMIWKLMVAMGGIKRIGVGPDSGLEGNITACVPQPYLLLLGGFEIDYENGTRQFNVTCDNCTLSNCVKFGYQNVLIIHQPSFVMLPVNLSEPWYAERGLQILESLNGLLKREKRVAGMIVAGIVTFIAFLISLSTAVVALSQSVQTAAFVDNLSMNVSQALELQEDIDIKMEEKLNALFDTVIYLGRSLEALKHRNHLQCHGEYRWICVTSLAYNMTDYNWQMVQDHLKGAWSHGNETSDLLKLHQQILSIQQAGRISLSPAQVAQSLYDHLKTLVPSSFFAKQIVRGLGLLAVGLLLMFLFFVIFSQYVRSMFLTLAVQLHYQKLITSKRPVSQ